MEILTTIVKGIHLTCCKTLDPVLNIGSLKVLPNRNHQNFT